MLKIEIEKNHSDFHLSLSLHIASGFTALYGASGSGKTTTLNLIAGLLKPSDGEITLHGTVLFSKTRRINLSPQQRRIGYIFQESRLFPHLSVQENLAFGYHQLPARQRKFDLSDVIEVTGVGSFLERSPGNLSGGEKQRVAIARALLASPEFLLMDEPVAALDIPTRYALLKFIKHIHQELTLPILYVSHDVSHVLTFADEVVVLRHGRIIGCGPPNAMLDELISGPLVPYEDVPNILDATVTSHDLEKHVSFANTERLQLTLPHLDLPTGASVTLNIPASEIILATERPHGLSASNVLPGTIRALHGLGERILVEIDAGDTFRVEIVPATVARLALTPRKPVYLIIKASSFRKISA